MARRGEATDGFIGRVRELTGLVAALDAARLVTLVGAPGIGKSRLALEVANDVERSEPGSVRIVGLAGVEDGRRVAATVASELAAPEAPGRSLEESVAARVGSRHLVLVLDDCEHVLAGCAALADVLLRACPRLRILVTSRRPLGMAGEHVEQLAALAVPDPGTPELPELLLRYDAVAMFAARASDVRPGFGLNGYTAPDVARICRRLEGVPLAIELAAARIATLTPAEVLIRLDASFELLTGAAGRHATLAAALDCSHDLLDVPEQVLLRRLSVFGASFDASAAQAVCSGGPVAPEAVGELLVQLVASSLVLADTRVERHRLAETVRAYAADRLERAGERAELRETHAHFYLAMAEAAEPELTGPDQERWLRRLETEVANMRAAVEWSLGQGRVEWGLRIAGALVLFWRVRCRFGEGRELLEASLRAADGAAPAFVTKALWGAGFLAHMAGDSDAAIVPLQASLAQARRAHDLRGSARALLVLGNCLQAGDGDAALAMLQESAALARAAGDSWCQAHALGIAAFGHTYRDEPAIARRLFEDCLAVARAAEDKQSLRIALLGLGALDAALGDFDTAEELLDEALIVAEALGDEYTKAIALAHLGQIAIGRGSYVRAREQLDEAIAVLREVRPAETVVALVARATVARAQGERHHARRLMAEALTVARAGDASPTPALQGMAELLAQDGRPVTARRLFDEALEMARLNGDKAGAAQALHGLGELAAARDDVKGAVLLYREALALQHEAGRRPDVAITLEAIAGLAQLSGRDEQAARLRGAVATLRGVAEQASGEDRLGAAFAAGAALSLEEAVAEARQGRFDGAHPPRDWSSLTETERQVAALAAEGLTNQEIAGVLFLSLGTVKAHLAHVFRKLGIARRRELLRRPGASVPSHY